MNIDCAHGLQPLSIFVLLFSFGIDNVTLFTWEGHFFGGFVEIKSKYYVWELLADFGIYFGFMYPKPDSESIKTNFTFVKQTRMHGLKLIRMDSAKRKKNTFRIFATHVISILDLSLITLFQLLWHLFVIHLLDLSFKVNWSNVSICFHLKSLIQLNKKQNQTKLDEFYEINFPLIKPNILIKHNMLFIWGKNGKLNIENVLKNATFLRHFDNWEKSARWHFQSISKESKRNEFSRFSRIQRIHFSIIRKYERTICNHVFSWRKNYPPKKTKCMYAMYNGFQGRCNPWLILLPNRWVYGLSKVRMNASTWNVQQKQVMNKRWF